MEKTRERKIVDEILDSVSDKKGQEPVVLDLQGISSLCDYFVISSAPSIRQVKAIADAVKDRLEELGVELLRQEGLREGRWALLDYGDIVVHLFVTEDRDHYQLERIWKDAPTLDIDTDSALKV